MNIKNILKISLGAAALVATQMSCINDDKWDAPEVICNNKFDAPTTTMAAVAALVPAAATGSGAAYTFPVDGTAIIFDGYVVSSDAGGNFYKTISFQDSPTNPTVGFTVGINKSLNYADFPVGAHIRIKANGMKIGKSYGVITLGVADPDYTIGRIPESIISRYIAGVCDGNGLEIADVVPTEVTISKLLTSGDKYINTLVKVKNVQFDDTEIGLKLMNTDASGAYIDTDRNIVDPTGSTTIRTDGFFKATSYVIPNSKGEITFVASKYQSPTSTSVAYQNIIRSISDLNLSEVLPNKLFVEGFKDFTTNGWTTYSVSGAPVWNIAQYGRPVPCAAMSGLGSVNEDWLVSKSISLDGYTSASFSFDSDGNYAGNPLEVYVTTDTYTGGNPATLNWVKLNAAFDTVLTNFYPVGTPWAKSGDVSLTPYLNKNIRIAFKYTNSSSSVASSWEIDNFKVIANK